MAVSSQFIILFSAINLIEMIKFLPMLSIPAADVIINTDKAFVLQRIGTYSSKLTEEIVHTFVPLDNLCVASPDTDVCVFTSKTKRTDVVELATILSPRETATILPRYDNDQVFNFIAKDLHRVHQNNHRNKFILKTNSAAHLIDDQFHTTNDIKYPPLDSSKFVVDTNQSDIIRMTPTSSAAILRQITANKIGFDFLTNTELMPFLSAVMSSIDKSYKITDLSESLDLFLQLIVAQSIYLLRSCSSHQQDSSTGKPCFIISTLFLRPLLESNTAFLIYRLIPLPTMVNDEKYMYSNMPEVIGVNTNDQTVILWNTAPKKSECLFSIFVYCQKKPPSIQIHNSPCLSELFSDDTRIAGSCQVTRSREIQTDIMNIDSNIWLFTHNDEPVYCHTHSDTGELGSIISITEPSIIRMPCGSAMKCTNTELPPSPCINRTVIIKSNFIGRQEQLSSIPWSIKNMTEQLISMNKLTTKNSYTDILHDVNDKKLTVTDMIKEFGAMILSIFFLALLSFILFFIRWIKHTVHQRINTLEKDVDDLLHPIVQNAKKFDFNV